MIHYGSIHTRPGALTPETNKDTATKPPGAPKKPSRSAQRRQLFREAEQVREDELEEAQRKAAIDAAYQLQQERGKRHQTRYNAMLESGTWKGTESRVVNAPPSSKTTAANAQDQDQKVFVKGRRGDRNTTGTWWSKQARMEHVARARSSTCPRRGACNCTAGYTFNIHKDFLQCNATGVHCGCAAFEQGDDGPFECVCGHSSARHKWLKDDNETE